MLDGERSATADHFGDADGGRSRAGWGLAVIERDAFRGLPAVGGLIEHEVLAGAVRDRGRAAVVRAVRAAIEEAREGLRAGREMAADPRRLAERSIEILERERASIRPVINATGVLLHTGLGRAPLAREAIDAVAAVARGYCSLELDLEEGERGRRTAGIERLIRELTGAEAATAVNNNAAATMLVLKSLAAGREVIVSRGELVEIGGSFRLPEILEASGARLREVGTTNKTRLVDYERAIGPETAAILRVHRSNFEIVGFTEAPELPELVRLAHDRGIWAIDDIGSGAIDLAELPSQAGAEPTARGSLSAGADVILFSGDKLLGGPQCGVIAGTKRAIEQIESDPLMRALRLDKMVLAALEATLQLALEPERALKGIPLWAMAAVPEEALLARAANLARSLCERFGYSAKCVPSDSFLGGGSVPTRVIPSAAVAISAPFPGGVASESVLAKALRRGDPPVIARVQKGAVLLDLRTIPEECEAELLDALKKVCQNRDGSGARNGLEPSGGKPG